MKKEVLTSSGYRVLAVIAAAIMLLCILAPAQGQFTAYGTENEQADDIVLAETEGAASLAPQASVKDKWGERIPTLTPLLSGNDDGGGYSQDPPAANLEAINAFVERLYTVVLDRDSDSEKASHVNALAAHAINGAQAAEGFFFSEEMNNRGLSDEQWIDICYRTFLDREADAGGRENWLNALASGASRYFVFAGFVGSDEFSGICASYGIDRGSYASPEPRDQSSDVRAFVYRLYEECLGRTPEPDGLNNWCAALLSGTATGTGVARGFFYSEEFETKYTTNTQIVTAAYKALLGRDPDPAGLADWVSRLDGGASKDVIFHGFGMSAEFKGICDTYGIAQGVIADPNVPGAPSDPVDQAALLVGTWLCTDGYVNDEGVETDDIFYLHADGTGVNNFIGVWEEDITWTLSGNVLTIIHTSDGWPEVYEIEFANDDILLLTPIDPDGVEVYEGYITYIRQ